MAIARQIFYNNGSFVCPAGVYFARVKGTKAQSAGPILTPAASLNYVDSLGNAFMAGSNTTGPIGDGTIVTRSSPTLVVGGLNFVKVMSVLSSFGLTTQGKMYSWGTNTAGQLGQGTTTNVSSPVAVVGGLVFQDFTVSNDGNWVIAQTPGGSLYGWGVNNEGMLGIGNSTTAVSSPTLVVGGLSFKYFQTNGEANGFAPGTLALTSAGALYAWGDNDHGQIGDGTITARSSPTLVLGGLVFARVSANAAINLNGGVANVAGITAAGVAYAWGSNDAGQIGDGTILARSSPVLVVGGLKFQQIAVGTGANNTTTMMGLDFSGKLWAWGTNLNGACGTGVAPTVTAAYSSPTLVVGGLTFAKIIPTLGNSGLSGATAWMGITNTGAMYSWGGDTTGSLANGTTVGGACSSPTLVLGGLTWKNIWNTNGNGCFGQTVNGLVYAWGPNTFGQLGVGDVLARSSPTLVLGGISGRVADNEWFYETPTVPGTTYAVSFGPASASFGGQTIGINALDTIEVFYEQ